MEDTRHKVYEPPVLVDYGTLTELTASSQAHGHEDGMGKAHGTPMSHPMHP